MPKHSCEFILPNGESCKAMPLTGQSFCISHTQDPRSMAIKINGSRRGGKARFNPDAITGWDKGSIESMGDLRDMLSALAVAGMRGTVSTSRLSALAAVANSLSKVIEGSDLEARIKAIEDRQAALGMRP